MRFSTYAFMVVCLWVDVGLVRNVGVSETTLPNLMSTGLLEIELYLALVVVVITLHVMTNPPLDRGPRRPKRKGGKKAGSKRATSTF